MGTRSKGYSGTNAIIGIVFLVLAMMAVFWLAKSIFSILAWAAPLLLIATLIIDYRVIINYGKWLMNLLKSNLVSGILFSLLTIVGFPVVSVLLLGRALLNKKVKSLQQEFQQKEQAEFTDYEIVEEEIITPLELPELERRKSVKTDDYEELFD